MTEQERLTQLALLMREHAAVTKSLIWRVGILWVVVLAVVIYLLLR